VNRFSRASQPDRGNPGSQLSPGARRQIDSLLAAQPETAPLLALLTAVLEEAQGGQWETIAADTLLRPERSPGTPLLAGAVISLDERRLDAWARRVLDLAGGTSPEAVSLVTAARAPRLDARALVQAALNTDSNGLASIATTLDVAPDALAVAADLVAMPLMQALRRRFGPAVDAQWSEGWCPVCGDWPLLAELRGLDRARRLRCGRCGGDWAQSGIRCLYCDAIGAAHRAALVSEGNNESRKVETCSQCRGYLKSVSTLRAWPGDEVCLADLATVDLDIVALERDFARPEPRRLDVGARVLG